LHIVAAAVIALFNVVCKVANICKSRGNNTFLTKVIIFHYQRHVASITCGLDLLYSIEHQKLERMENAIAANTTEFHNQQNAQVQTAVATPAKAQVQAAEGYGEMLEEAEFNRYGLMIPFILITACLAGVGVWAMGNGFNVPILSLLALCAVIPLSLMLAVTPMKIIIPACVASCVVSIAVILAYVV
jgi:hypothetical protein